MLNPIASEAIFSATYVDNYIDSVENLPDDVQRQLSRIRDIDVRYRNHLRDVDHYYDVWKTMQTNKTVSPNRRARTVARVQQSLINAQELGDEKMQIVNQLQELIDQKTRQLDMDQKNLNIKENQHHQEDNQCTMPPHKLSRSHSPSREGSATNGGNGGNGNVGGNGCGNSNGNGEASIIKEVHTSGPYSGGNSLGGSGNGTSTPTSDRSGHACNGNVSQLSSNCSTNLANAAANNASLNVNVGSDSQRTASKRLRRRNEPAGHVEVCGNESNSANEAASSGGGGGGADRSSIGGNSNTALKSATTGGGSNASQRKNSMQVQGGQMTGTTGSSTMGSANMTTGGAGNVGGGNNSGKRKKRKARGTQQATNAQNAREETPPPDPIDPDEPTYCLCDQISFGEMILCDNDLCPIEWFHFSCVALVLKPKGKWYCPNCRGDRPNVMKPKAQFLKELERYNKEKEERT